MRWIFPISFVLVFSQPVTAALKKCVDDNGVAHYYSSILPPECHDKTTVEMNKLGVVIRKNEAVDKTLPVIDKAQQEAAEQKQKIEQRRDEVLLKTYTSEKEIDWALERNVHPIELNIVGIEKRLMIIRAQLQSLQQQATEAERTNSPTLAAIKEDMLPVERGVASLQKELIENQLRIKNIQEKFEIDRKRFLELTQILQ
ncbi:MAG: hypothetical protein K0U40_03780 [Betaproteobacteria bacterium]|nr:hypothetical protein [Betaproteobacteria bacterium]